MADSIQTKHKRRSEQRSSVLKSLASGKTASNINEKVANDSYMIAAGGLAVLESPYDPYLYVTSWEDNSMLFSCISTLRDGLSGYGYSLFVPIGASEEVEVQIRKERRRLRSALSHLGGEDSFITILKKCVTDLGVCGAMAIEIMRDHKGKIMQAEHVCAAQIKLTERARNEAPIAFVEHVPVLAEEGDEDPRIEYKRQVKYRYPRLYVQLTDTSIDKVIFKEFGDPRNIDRLTGEEATEETPTWRYANELIYYREYNPSGSPYGIPRWITALHAIAGSSFVDKANANTFKNNNIPSMAVLVNGGMLTQDSEARIQDLIKTNIEGDSNLSRFVVIEAESLMEGDEAGAVKMQIVPLTDVQRTEGMFSEYRKRCDDDIRLPWRFPEIVLGQSANWTASAIDSAKRHTDEQILAPERMTIEKWLNRYLSYGLGFEYVQIALNTPSTTDNAILAQIITGMEKTGGITPEIAHMILSQILGRNLPPISDDIPKDVPFSATMAERVKNQADPAEVGQQVTALK